MTLPPHLAARVFDTPLLIHRAKLDAILHVLGPKWNFEVQGPKPKAFNEDEWSEDTPSRGDCRPYELRNGVAVIPIMGTLVQRAHGLQAFSGLTSYQTIAASFDAAIADGQANAILFEVDSPGGEVNGCFDLADKIYNARGVKPMTAISHDWACSAAYMLASACGDLVLTQTGEVGSIGVVMTHVDQSKQNEMLGLAVTYIYAGEHKTDGWPDKPLDPDTRNRFQQDCDALYRLFCAGVSRARAIEIDDVVATRALTFRGEEAVARGLADRVSTFDETLATLADTSRPSSGFGGTNFHRANAAHQTEKTTMNGNRAAATVDSVTAEYESRIATLQTQHATALAAAHTAGHAEGMKAGATKAAERIKGILDNEEAQGRDAQARTLAFDTDISPEQAVAVLKTGAKAEALAPADAKAAVAGAMAEGFGKAMNAVKNPDVGADAGAEDADSPEAISARAVAQIYPKRVA